MSRNGMFSSSKKLPDYHSPEEIYKMIDEAKKDKSKKAKRNRLILETLWKTGIRNSELREMKKRDIDFNDRIMIVRDGKGGKDRVVRMDEQLSSLLGFYTDNKSDNDFIFPGRNDLEPLSSRQLERIINKYADKAGINNSFPHKWRHSFAVYGLKQGMTLRSIQKLLGHSSLTVTQKYLQLTDDDIKRDYDQNMEFKNPYG